jgi:REP element-mobilizing transposase RayT
MSHQTRFKSHHSEAFYHCISRTVNGENLFDDQAKEMLRKHLHQVADFSGVKIITYVFMSNHFHVLAKVDEQKNVSDAELLRRYKVLYPKPTQYAAAQIEMIEATLKGNGPEAQKLRDKLLARMGDVSQFMKTFKQRYSIWFNRNHKRFGPLWSERFTSTIVEGDRHFALQTVAAYIDLNPIRAGMVRDPKDYRWCGYGEAQSEGGPLLDGLRFAVPGGDKLRDSDLLAAYRLRLFGKGALSKRGAPNAARICEEDVSKVVKAGGKLTGDERLHSRQGSLSRGAVIGGCSFVAEHWEKYQKQTRRRAHMPPRPFSDDADDNWTDLYSMRHGS